MIAECFGDFVAERGLILRAKQYPLNRLNVRDSGRSFDKALRQPAFGGSVFGTRTQCNLCSLVSPGGRESVVRFPCYCRALLGSNIGAEFVRYSKVMAG